MVTATKGKHNLSLGGEFALDKTMFLANLYNYGEIGFSTSAPTSTGVTLADFLTGQINSFEQDSPYTTHLSTWHTALFAQDDYRITPRLTVNLDCGGTSIHLPRKPMTGRSRLFPASNPLSQRQPRSAWYSLGQRRRSRHRQHVVLPHFASSRYCMGSVWRRKNLHSQRSGHLLRQPQWKRMEPARKRHAVRHSQRFWL